MKQGAIVHEVPPEMIMQWLDSESAPEETAAVASHVHGCAECRTMMAELQKGSTKLAAWEVPDSGQARIALDRLRSRTERQQGSRVASLLRPRYAAALCALLLALTWWAQLSPSRIHVD